MWHPDGSSRQAATSTLFGGASLSRPARPLCRRPEDQAHPRVAGTLSSGSPGLSVMITPRKGGDDRLRGQAALERSPGHLRVRVARLRQQPTLARGHGLGRGLDEPGHLTGVGGHVLGQRGQRELRCGDVIAAGLQALDDAAPARALGPCAVDKNDIRPVFISGIPSWSLPADRADPTMHGRPGAAVSAALLHFGNGKNHWPFGKIKFFYPNDRWWHIPRSR